jgi:ribulose kinase
VFSHDTDEPIPVTGPSFSNDGNDRNVILWLDHRPVAETKDDKFDRPPSTAFCRRPDERGNGDPEDSVVKEPYAGGVVRSLYCKFYDLVDALTHMATGTETRSFYKTVHEQGHVSMGLDGIVQGLQEDFYECVGLKNLTKDNFKRIGGVNRVNHAPLIALNKCESC